MRVLDQRNDAVGAVAVEWHWFLISVRPVETPTLIRWTALPMIFIWRLGANSNPQMILWNQHGSSNQSRALRPFFCTAFEPANAIAKSYENHQ
jgi:hypothetical protein